MSLISAWDAAAVAVFVGSWGGYNLFLDGDCRSLGGINATMPVLRRHWMARLLTRENRIFDSTLIGHVIHSASFFASATLVVLAGLIGALGSADVIAAAMSKVSVLLSVEQEKVEFKLLLLIAVFIYAFFKFTWALRQFNYFCAVVGSAPEPRAEGVDSDAYAERMATILTHAAGELNAGVRAYYFAFAVLGWFIDPRVFIAVTLFMIAVLTRRQLWSPTARALRRQIADLERR